MPSLMRQRRSSSPSRTVAHFLVWPTTTPLGSNCSGRGGAGAASETFVVVFRWRLRSWERAESACFSQSTFLACFRRFLRFFAVMLMVVLLTRALHSEQTQARGHEQSQQRQAPYKFRV